MARVLVTAATGTVGRHVVADLADRGVAVAAGTRDPDHACGTVADGAATVEFDFERPETWGDALAAVDEVFLARPPGVGVADVRSFVDAAARVGVEHVVFLSTLGADRNPLLPHRRIERHVERTDLAYTHLRASFFAQNLHEVHGPDVREHDEIFVPAGSGRTSFIDARDVAAVAATAVAEPGHRNTAYDLTGPEALTYREVADRFSTVLDREITYPDPSIREFVPRMRARGHPLGYVLLMVGIYTIARLGLAGRVTDDVERLLGRPPRTIDDYVRDYAERFAPDTNAETSVHTASAGITVGGLSTAAASTQRVEPADPPPDAIIRLVNPVLKRVLRSPLHSVVSDHLLLLTVTGRTTGTQYTFPVGYEDHDGTLTVISHGTNWWKNLRDGGGTVSVVLRGERRTGHATVEETNDRVAEHLHDFFQRKGVGADRRTGLSIQGDAVPDVDALGDVVDHIVVVTIDLDDEPTAGAHRTSSRVNG